MTRLKVGILDLLTNTPREPRFQSHVMAPNLASIMPQCVGVWAEELGCEVFYETFTGRENLLTCFPEDLDVLFISCFSRASYLAYGISRAWRSKGAVTVMGGPHARSFAEHARQYFDYVCKFTDKEVVRSILLERAQRPIGQVVSAAGQPKILPGVRQRFRFLDVGMRKATRWFRVVPVLGSLGCPYTCSFCIDAPIAYKPLPFEGVVDDLQAAQERYGPDTVIGWHDPNFGVRFKEIMAAIERSGTTLMHAAESSLSLLGEEHLKALQRHNFVAMLPGIESWFECGAKGGTKTARGKEKLDRVCAHVQQILSYIPCVQANFVLGLDGEPEESWELSKQFVDRVPGVFPGYSLLTDFNNSPLSAQLAREGRTTAVPYPLLDNNFAINVKLGSRDPIQFYDQVIDLMEHTWSWAALGRRFSDNRRGVIKAINFGRALSEGRGRTAHHRRIRRLLKEEPGFLEFMRGEQPLPPAFYFEEIRHQLGRYAKLVPPELMTPEGFVRTLASAPAPKAVAAAEVIEVPAIQIDEWGGAPALAPNETSPRIELPAAPAARAGELLPPAASRRTV